MKTNIAGIKDVIVTGMIGYYLQDNLEPEAKHTILKRIFTRLLSEYCPEDVKDKIQDIIKRLKYHLHLR